MLVNMFLGNLTSGLRQFTLHVLDFLEFNIFDIKRIQNMTSFLWIIYTCVIILRF